MRKQGELQGGVASLYSLASIAGPLLMTQTLARFTGKGSAIYFPGAAFVVAGFLALVCLIFFVLSLHPDEGQAN